MCLTRTISEDDMAEDVTSPTLLSWESLQYFSAAPSILDVNPFGDNVDKVGPTKRPFQPQPRSTEPGHQSLEHLLRPKIVHVLNNRKYSGNFYNWGQVY